DAGRILRIEFVREERLRMLQRTRCVDAPRTLDRICNGQPDVLAIVVREVEVVLTEATREPLRSTDQRRPREVRPHAIVHVRQEDRRIADPDRLVGCGRGHYFMTASSHLPTSAGVPGGMYSIWMSAPASDRSRRRSATSSIGPMTWHSRTISSEIAAIEPSASRSAQAAREAATSSSSVPSRTVVLVNGAIVNSWPGRPASFAPAARSSRSWPKSRRGQWIGKMPSPISPVWWIDFGVIAAIHTGIFVLGRW